MGQGRSQKLTPGRPRVSGSGWWGIGGGAGTSMGHGSELGETYGGWSGQWWQVLLTVSLRRGQAVAIGLGKTEVAGHPSQRTRHLLRAEEAGVTSAREPK